MAGARPKDVHVHTDFRDERTGPSYQEKDALSGLSLSKLSKTLSGLLPESELVKQNDVISLCRKVIDMCGPYLHCMVNVILNYDRRNTRGDYGGDMRTSYSLGVENWAVTGSVAEGIALSGLVFPVAGSDVDVMLPFPININEMHVISVHPDVHIGYARLALKIPQMFKNDFKDKLPDSPEDFLSSTKAKSVDQMKYIKSVGPAVKFTHPVVKSLGILNGMDIVTCVVYPSWPDVAGEWILRERSCSWPTEELISEVKDGGCHLVPMAHRSSLHPDIEWRFSFSKAERNLIQSLTSKQKHCFLLFKVLCIHAIGESELFKAFFLKNIFLWSCERHPEDCWTSDTTAARVLDLIDELLACLHNRKLPHYFIRANNLIEHISSESIDDIILRLESLRYNPLDYIAELKREKKSQHREGSDYLVDAVAGAFKGFHEFYRAFKD